MAPARASKRKRMLALFLALAVAACTTDFEKQYADAEQWRQDAAASGYEWLETEGLLKEASEQEALGNTDAALELIGKARLQAEMAVRQAEHEAQAWRTRVVR